VNLAPLLGENYNNWLPIMILVFSIIFLFKLQDKTFKFLKLNKIFDELASPSDELCRNGREIINQARSLEERKIARSEGNLAVNPTTSKTTQKPISSVNTSEFLQKYKNAKPTKVVEEIERTSSSSQDDDARALLFSSKKSTKKTVNDNPLLPTANSLKQNGKFQRLPE
jgi:hypothetical protein